MSRRLRSTLIASAFLVIWSATVFARVAPIPFHELVRRSAVVVVARVESVKPRLLRPLGDDYATAKVIEIWKGPRDLAEVRFLASPTWMCDIADANVGETAVLFLEWDEEERRYTIAHSGRGRMPIREVRSVELATIWPDVWLPKGTPTEAGPEPQYEFIRSIAVAVLKQLVLESGTTSSAD